MDLIDDNNKMVLNECIEALGLILEYNLKDHPAHQHAIRVGEGCALVGEKVGLKPKTIQRLYYAGLIHDVGKISIDLNILSKKGPLNAEEFEAVKLHSVYGSRIVASLHELSDMALWVRWHHEKWDGTGYPDGLYKDELPVEIQILGAIDCFDSLQTPRMDRPAHTPDDAFNILNQYRGTHYNPDIIDLVFEMHREKTLIPGRSSEEFLQLKDKYINFPLNGSNDYFGEYYGIMGLYPILRLFARVIDAKHHYTRGHSIRVSLLSGYVAKEMGLSRDDVIKTEIAGLLHDAGKVSIPNDILNKVDKPTKKEWEIIKYHPVHSSEILKKVTPFSDISEIVYNHHRWADGRGYPEKNSPDTANIISQIIAVVDAYDAITTERPYSPAQLPSTAFKKIEERLGSQFNREAGEILINTSPKYINALIDMNVEKFYPDFNIM